MSVSLNVHLLPTLVSPEELSGSTVVVIDVLRATTTLVQALASGAREVVPCLEIDEARAGKAKLAEQALLGGERGGVKIEGFDLGNSPGEYTPEVVAGRTILFTTTNGTKAMQRCRAAQRVLIGAFVNFSAICHALSTAPCIDLVCAGTDNQITREDVLFAGAVADDLVEHAGGDKSTKYLLNDQAYIALDAWRAARQNLRSQPLIECLRSSRGGRNLLELGHDDDIHLAADLDRFTLLPELDLATWRIQSARNDGKRI